VAKVRQTRVPEPSVSIYTQIRAPDPPLAPSTRFAAHLGGIRTVTREYPICSRNTQDACDTSETPPPSGPIVSVTALTFLRSDNLQAGFCL
jgi:hypothetical protein